MWQGSRAKSAWQEGEFFLFNKADWRLICDHFKSSERKAFRSAYMRKRMKEILAQLVKLKNASGQTRENKKVCHFLTY